MILLLKDFHIVSHTSLGTMICVVSPENCASQKATRIPLWHSPFLVTAPSVRNFKVGLCLEETWCLFKDHFGVLLISSLPRMLLSHFPSTHHWKGLLKNLEISGMPHSWSAATSTSPWYLGQSWKTDKEERTILCCIEHSWQGFGTGVVVVTCVGGGIELPCASCSHFQPALTPVCDTSWEVLSLGYRRNPISLSPHRGSSNAWPSCQLGGTPKQPQFA